MPPSRKRRAQAEASPTPPPARRRRSGVAEVAEDASDVDADDYDGEEDGEVGGSTQDQLVKKLVRLALACEYARQPLRRADIAAKVLAPNHTRSFKLVFDAAEARLKDVFGMTLAELPIKEKVTISQKRAAQRANGNSQGGGGSSKAYILTSTLPSSLRVPPILPPAKIPSTAAEASYTGLYTLVISVIYLSQGSRISENKLERYLKKCNADNYVLGGEKTEKVLKRMEKEGYIVKIREREPGGEETIEWIVGPRGRVEVGETGVVALVKGVFGKRDVDVEELEDKLEKSLGVGTFKRKVRRQGADENDREQDREQEPASDAVRSSERTTAGPSRRTGAVEGRTESATNSSRGHTRPEASGSRRSDRRSRQDLVNGEAEDDDDDEEEDEAEEADENDEDEEDDDEDEDEDE